ncbi:NUDIX domain-containing protein [uncultured Tateyamaria sp.]|uniref:NUDIX domain-containing protein n=1 Tax=uncultured Tateyamaria sp. TaxID=455651 RepID=UPI002634F75A|nr:NUDIX domain-containing protein [uncultured Tateyamaria sp.]
MTDMFFYGTLRHVPLLECVLGRDASDLDVTAAELPGYVARNGEAGLYPVLVAQGSGMAQGVLVRGLDGDALARLNFYEGGFDYAVGAAALSNGALAQVYLPSDAVEAEDGAWLFDAWCAKWAEMTVIAAREAMSHFGRLSPQEMARQLPRMRARAWSQILARSGDHGDGVLHGAVDIRHHARVYANFFALDELQLRHETFDGGISEELDRAVFVNADATIVLPYDPVRDRVLLVEQVRMGPIVRRDPHVWQLEPVAGLVDPGEQPAETAHREAQEEAGLQFRSLEDVGHCYASPAASTDFFHLYVGLCDLPDGTAGVAGKEDEGENIRSHVLSFEALMEMAEARRTVNAPLTLLTYWLAHHRARLRAGDVG